MKNNKATYAIITATLTLIIVTQILIPTFAAKNYQTLKVNGHTQLEIAEYIATHGVDFNRAEDAFDVEASTAAPYSSGKLKQREIDKAVAAINTYRYIAGINDTVYADDALNANAADAALISAVNEYLSHNPECPAGMQKDLYDRCYKGCASSLLSASFFGTNNDILRAYSFTKHVSYLIADFGAINAQKVGHRTWLLSQRLQTVGIGAARSGQKESAAVTPHTVITDEPCDLVAWPAQNTPIEFFESTFKPLWSLSINASLNSDVTVKITNKNTQNTWTLTSGNTYDYSAGAEYLWVDRSQDTIMPVSTVIFRPGDAALIKAGDTYDVEVSGSEFKTVRYTVNFFSLPEDLHVHTAQSRITDRQPTCSSDGSVHYVCTTCGQTVSYSLPALPHKDENCNGICDNCGADAPNRIYQYIVDQHAAAVQTETTTAQPDPDPVTAPSTPAEDTTTPTTPATEPITTPVTPPESTTGPSPSASSSNIGLSNLMSFFMKLIQALIALFR